MAAISESQAFYTIESQDKSNVVDNKAMENADINIMACDDTEISKKRKRNSISLRSQNTQKTKNAGDPDFKDEKNEKNQGLQTEFSSSVSFWWGRRILKIN